MDNRVPETDRTLVEVIDGDVFRFRLTNGRGISEVWDSGAKAWKPGWPDPETDGRPLSAGMMARVGLTDELLKA